MKICLVTKGCKYFSSKPKSQTYARIYEVQCEFLPLTYPVSCSLSEGTSVKHFKYVLRNLFLCTYVYTCIDYKELVSYYTLCSAV